jgi:hypothetical protein
MKRRHCLGLGLSTLLARVVRRIGRRQTGCPYPVAEFYAAAAGITAAFRRHRLNAEDGEVVVQVEADIELRVEVNRLEAKFLLVHILNVLSKTVFTLQ